MAHLPHRLNDVLKALLFWGSIVPFTLGISLAMMVVGAFEKLTGGTTKYAGRRQHVLATVWGRTIINATPGWSITIEGREHLPAARHPLVMVANHESMADICAMYFLGVQFRWLAKASIFKVPFVGAPMRLAGYVPVERGNPKSHADALEACAQRLRSGLSVFFFPEGTRSETHELRPFKTGAFKLAEECGVDILPIALSGAGMMLPKGRAVPGKAHIRIRILPRIRKAPGESLENYAARARDLISQAHAAISNQV